MASETYNLKEERTQKIKYDTDKKNVLFKNKFIAMFIAVLCTALWGNMIPAIRLGFDFFGITAENISSEILFAGLCFSLSGIYTLIFLCLKEKKLIFPSKKTWKDIFVLGFVQTTLQYVFLYIGIPNTSGFNASIISSSGTLLIVILSHFIYKNDKMDLKKCVGCFLGLLGVLALSFNSVSDISPMFTLKGEGMIFFSTLTFVLTTPLCKKLSKYEVTEVFTGYSFLIGGIILLVLGVLGKGYLDINTEGLIMLVYLSIAAAVAGALWNCLLKYNKVSEITVYNFLVPIFGAISSGIMLGEKIFRVKSLICLVLICLGIYFVGSNSKFLKLIEKKYNNREQNYV